jgi:hypothetical protein
MISELAEKLIRSQLRNKGTASAGPQVAEKNPPGFSPCFARSAIQLTLRHFSSSCSVVPQRGDRNPGLCPWRMPPLNLAHF